MRQVLITRNRPDAEATAQRVRAYGFEPIIAPLFDFKACPVLWPAPPYDGAMATSRQALLLLPEAERTRLQPLPLFVVGPATAATAQALGFHDIRQGAGDATALAELVLKNATDRTHLLFLTGDPHRPELEAALKERIRLSVIPLYKSHVRADFPAEALACLTDPHPIWLHFSLQSADHAVRLLNQTTQAGLLQKACHIALSPAICAHLLQLGALDCRAAAKPDLESMLTCLQQKK